MKVIGSISKLTALLFHSFSSLRLKKIVHGVSGWTDRDSMKAYISQIRRCLLDDESGHTLDERFPQEAVDMMSEKFVRRFRPATVAMVCLFVSIEMNTTKYRGESILTPSSFLSLSPHVSSIGEYYREHE